MAALVEQRSKITAKGQTTVPKAVRQALGVSYGGEIAFRVDERGGVSVRRIDADEADPVVDGFLDFLARDMLLHPHNIAAFPPALAERMAALADGIEVDPDAEIDGPVAL